MVLECCLWVFLWVWFAYGWFVVVLFCDDATGCDCALIFSVS